MLLPFSRSMDIAMTVQRHMKLHSSVSYQERPHLAHSLTMLHSYTIGVILFYGKWKGSYLQKGASVLSNANADLADR
jgi:hypothetical protein